MKARAGAAVLLCASLAAPASADELALAGASRGANSDYAFAGAVLPVLGGSLGAGPAIRLWADYLDYSYTGGVGTVTAAGLGGALAGVYQFSGAWGWTNLGAGASYRNTHLSVFDPGNDQRGSRVYFNLQTDGGYNIDEAWRARDFVSYTPSTDGYQAQIGLDRAVLESLRIGVSAAFQGDRNYHQTSEGLTAFFQVSPGFEIDPAVGFSQGGGESSPYGSLTLVLTVN